MGNIFAKRASILPFFLSVIVIGCQGDEFQKEKVVSRPGLADVHFVEKENEGMNRAIKTARSTVKQFIPILQKPRPNQGGFSIKAKISDENSDEHMWISDVLYDGKVFQGSISNEPLDVKNVNIGDSVRVKPNDISDWMFIEDGKLVGGYTIRVLRDSMTVEEKRALDNSLGFKIE